MESDFKRSLDLPAIALLWLRTSKIILGTTRDNPGFISSVVLAETSWMLVISYTLGREEIGEVIEALLRTHDLVFENTEAKYRALPVYREGSSVEYADMLIAETAKLSGAHETVTFDPKTAREGGMRLPDSV